MESDVNNVNEIKLPEGFNWEVWVNRWDKMQDECVAKWAERLEIISRMVRDTQNSAARVVDLGCGTGSLMLEILKVLPEAQLIGIDFDPTLLPLARKRLAEYGERINLFLEDLRTDKWLRHLSEPVDAVVSATALHWLKPKELFELYGKIAKILRVGGIFLNSDPVSSENEYIQQAWEKNRKRMLSQNKVDRRLGWEDFWAEYMKALGPDICQVYKQFLIKLESGVEEGMPLVWHFDKLRAAGFTSVDCFWRCDCSAIYGGIFSKGRES
jgi:SAM-dependent methyltransferase